MGFNSGIVGLPNVGKSTLFNALTSTTIADAGNYPFCTIEPNTGRVIVPDSRLIRLAELGKSSKIIPTQLEFVDIAGLVRGASKGEGLGNQFLANIRETHSIVHVLRCFENSNITHVDGKIDPIRDIDTVETELMLSDMENLERRSKLIQKRSRSGEQSEKRLLDIINRLLNMLQKGEPSRTIRHWNEEDQIIANSLNLLTSKPIMYVCNVDEEAAAGGNQYSSAVAERAKIDNSEYLVISAAIESEISLLTNPEEKIEFLQSVGLEEAGLNRLIRTGYRLLKLVTFFTVGPKEARAWTVPQGATAPQAAGVIHTDFQRGFIRVEATSFSDFSDLGGEQAAKDAGRTRVEGANYKVQDGDILYFRYNV